MALPFSFKVKRQYHFATFENYRLNGKNANYDLVIATC